MTGGVRSFRMSGRVDAPVLLAKTAPLRTTGENQGGLFLGQAPKTHRILENGSFTLFDFIAEVRPGDAPHNHQSVWRPPA